jgi:hypothetical protein
MSSSSSGPTTSGPSGTSGGGDNIGGGQGGGQTYNGMSITPKPKSKLRPIPTIPDTSGGAGEVPEPVDLSLLAGQEQPPERRPLNNSGIGGSLVTQTGITGYAGIFIP